MQANPMQSNQIYFNRIQSTLIQSNPIQSTPQSWSLMPANPMPSTPMHHPPSHPPSTLLAWRGGGVLPGQSQNWPLCRNKVLSCVTQTSGIEQNAHKIAYLSAVLGFIGKSICLCKGLITNGTGHTLLSRKAAWGLNSCLYPLGEWY